MTPALTDAQIPLPLTLAQSYAPWRDLGAAWSADRAPPPANVGVPIFTATVTVPATSSANATWRLTLDAGAEHQQFVVDGTPAGQTPYCNLSGTVPGQPLTSTVAQAQRPLFILTNVNAPDLAPNLATLAASGIIHTAYSSSFTVANVGLQPASSNASVTVSHVPPGLTVTCSPATPAALAADSSMTCTLSGTPDTLGTYAFNVTTTDAADPNASNDSVTIPLAITEPPPATPVCTATPTTTADPNQSVSMACVVMAGTYNSVAGGRCTPDPAVTTAITCTGLAGSLGSKPTVTSRNSGGTASAPVDFEFTGTLAAVPLFGALGLWLSAMLLGGIGAARYRRRGR
jgi:hypothetical protein